MKSDEELRELERQVERSQLFVHTALSQQATRITEIESFLYGLIDVLSESGALSPELLEEAARRVRDEQRAEGDTAAPRIAIRIDAASAPPPQEVNCAERLPVCKAVCCRLNFALSREEVEAGHARWDLGRPYFIRRGPTSYCSHLDEGALGCSIYEQRPMPCRRYFCSTDPRIWKDFDGMVLNTEWIASHLGPDSPRLLSARSTMMHGNADLVDPRRLAAVASSKAAAPSTPPAPPEPAAPDDA